MTRVSMVIMSNMNDIRFEISSSNPELQERATQRANFVRLLVAERASPNLNDYVEDEELEDIWNRANNK